MGEPLGAKTNPVYVTQEAPHRDSYMYALEVISKTVMTAYTLFMAWNVAKAICPPLAVREQILVATLKQLWSQRRKEHDVHVPAAWVRQLYDDLRKGVPPDAD